jgi:hypothetical protein
VEFAKAAAMRPQIVGSAQPDQRGSEIERALFEVLENQKLLDGEARLTLVPPGSELLTQLLAARKNTQAPAVPGGTGDQQG